MMRDAATEFGGIVTRDNGNLRSRIYNWKFLQACQYLKGESEEVEELVTALSRGYGNIGETDVGPVTTPLISAAVDLLIGLTVTVKVVEDA